MIIAAALFLASVPAAQAVATGGPPTATIGPYHFHSDTFEIFSKEATDVVTVPVMIAPGHSNLIGAADQVEVEIATASTSASRVDASESPSPVGRRSDAAASRDAATGPGSRRVGPAL